MFVLKREMLHIGAEEIKTDISSSTPFFPENHIVYEIMWKNVMGRGRPQTTM